MKRPIRPGSVLFVSRGPSSSARDRVRKTSRTNHERPPLRQLCRRQRTSPICACEDHAVLRERQICRLSKSDGRDRQRHDRVACRPPVVSSISITSCSSFNEPALHRDRHPEDDRHGWPEACAVRAFRALALSPPTPRRTTPHRRQGR